MKYQPNSHGSKECGSGFCQDKKATFEGYWLLNFCLFTHFRCNHCGWAFSIHSSGVGKSIRGSCEYHATHFVWKIFEDYPLLYFCLLYSRYSDCESPLVYESLGAARQAFLWNHLMASMTDSSERDQVRLWHQCVVVDCSAVTTGLSSYPAGIEYNSSHCPHLGIITHSLLLFLDTQ